MKKLLLVLVLGFSYYNITMAEVSGEEAPFGINLTDWD